MTSIMSFLSANWGVIASVLLGLSELLALIPGIKSNSIFELVFNWLQSSVNAINPPQPPASLPKP